MPLTVRAKQLDEGIAVPRCAHAGDAAVDLRSTENMTLAPFERALVHTGIAIALPEGYAGLVIPRSGLALKHGVSVVNGPGLIDSGYRGEIGVVLVNLDPHEPFEVKRGDRIAQLSVVRVESVDFEIADELGETERSAGGFGSSGVEG